MAYIKPFRGLRPPAKMAKEVSSPPYDVISSDEARLLTKSNPNSFLRIIKPEIDYEKDHEPKGDDTHLHGLKNLKKFINDGILVQDEKNCFYLYQIKMGDHIQTGCMAAVSVEEYNIGLIKKHEFTRPNKENDRTRHIEITNANTGPVFLTCRNDGLFQNKISEIKKQQPEIFFVASDNTEHTLWKIDSLPQINLLIDYFKKIPNLYIADGHHRAASASRVQKIRKEGNINHTGDEAYNFFLAVIFPDDEMKIMDYNRVVKDLNGLTKEKLLKSIESNFIVTLNPSIVLPSENDVFLMFLDEEWFHLKAKDHIITENIVNSLGASILQDYLLAPLLDIDNPRTNKRIDFVGGIRGFKELERRCHTDCAIAFVLSPVKINDLFSVADSDNVMPPKSTWFEPKLRSGMVVRLID